MRLIKREDFLSRSYYKSKWGKEYINNEIIENVIVERVYTIIPPPTIDLSLPISSSQIEWGFYIGIFKCLSSTYLILSANKYNHLISEIYESYEAPNLGFTKIEEDVAYQLSNELEKLGLEYFENTIPDFDLLINALLSIIPQEINVSFGIMFNRDGYYDSKRKEIGINIATSQFEVLFALIHEYVHYLLSDENNSKISTYEEYLTDKSENICNEIARKVLKKFCPKIISKIIKDEISKLDLSGFIDTLFNITPIEYKILQKQTDNLNNYSNIINKIADKIICDLSDAISKTKDNISKTIIEQSGLVRLNGTDNNNLLKLIFQSVSSLISDSNYVISYKDGTISREYTNKKTISLSVYGNPAKIISEIIYYTSNHYVNIDGYNFNKSLFYICICECNNKKYLTVNINQENNEYDIFFDNDIIIKEGTIEINEPTANEIESILHKLNPQNELKPLNNKNNNELLEIIINKINPMLPDSNE